uniref:Putative ovule protein n=1 Tax=Solanum chacoense TaxID=4108 RepID=A0A0V0HDQ4_SOLCH
MFCFCCYSFYLNQFLAAKLNIYCRELSDQFICHIYCRLRIDKEYKFSQFDSEVAFHYKIQK